MNPDELQVLELISRRLDADLTESEQWELSRVLAADPRAANAMTGMTAVRRRLSGEFRSAAGTGPSPSLLQRIRGKIASLVSRRRPTEDVVGRVMPAHMADFQLAMNAAQGQDDAWTRIFRTYAPGIGALIYQHGFANEQEDLLQDIFLLLCRRIDSFRGDSSLKTWIYRVSMNHLNNYRERVHGKRKREISESQMGGTEDQPMTLDDFSADGGPTPDEALEQKQVRETVLAALGDIGEEIRTAVILRDLNELSYREIAEVLDVPEGTAKSRVARGRAALARKLLDRGVLGD